MRRIPLLLSLAFALATLAFPVLAADTPTDNPSSWCGPLPQNEALVYAGRSISGNECDPGEPCWQQKFKEVREAVDNGPFDLHAHLLYVEMIKKLGPAWRESAGTHYALLAEERGDAALHYLAQKLTIRIDERVKHTLKSLQADPLFAPAHLLAAELSTGIARWNLPFHNKPALLDLLGDPKEHVKMYGELCPTRVFELLWAGRFVSVDVATPAVHAAIIKYEFNRSIEQGTLALGFFWVQKMNANSAWVPPESDIRLLEEMRTKETSLPILDHLADARKGEGGGPEASALRAEIDRLFPCSDGGGLTNAATVRHLNLWGLTSYGGDRGVIHRDPEAARDFFEWTWRKARECDVWNQYSNPLLQLVPLIKLSPDRLREVDEYFARVYDPEHSLVFPSPDGVLADAYLGYGGPFAEKALHHAARELRRILSIRQDPRVQATLDESEEGAYPFYSLQEALTHLRLAEAHFLYTGKRDGWANAYLESGLEILERITPPTGNWLKGLLRGTEERASRVRELIRSSDSRPQAQEVPRRVKATTTEMALTAPSLPPTQKVAQQVEVVKTRATLHTPKLPGWEDVAQPLSEFELTDTTGRIWRLSDFRGRTVYIDWWATWCIPCRNMHPYLERLRTEISGDHAPLIVTFNTDEMRDSATKYLAERPHLQFPVVYAREYMMGLSRNTRLSFNAYPLAFIVCDGEVKHSQIDFFDSKKGDEWVEEMITTLSQATTACSASMAAKATN